MPRQYRGSIETTRYHTGINRGLRLLISKAFAALRKKGYFCKLDLGLTRGEGWAIIEEKTGKTAEEALAVFCCKQAREAFYDGQVYLSWNGNGREIADALHATGLQVDWDGTDGNTIRVLHPERADYILMRETMDERGTKGAAGYVRAGSRRGR